jgi:hypothetical protein
MLTQAWKACSTLALPARTASAECGAAGAAPFQNMAESKPSNSLSEEEGNCDYDLD